MANILNIKKPMNITNIIHTPIIFEKFWKPLFIHIRTLKFTFEIFLLKSEFNLLYEKFLNKGLYNISIFVEQSQSTLLFVKLYEE